MKHFLLFSGLILIYISSSGQSLINPALENHRVQETVLDIRSSVLSDDFSSNNNQVLPVTTLPGNASGIGSLSVMAPPPNDACNNAIALTVNAPCVNGTTMEGSVQGGESTSCQGGVSQSVWYRFTATATAMFVEVERTASSGCYLASAVYNGTCLPSNATAIACEDAAGGPNLNIHNLTGLTVGAVYLVQVTYTAGGPCGGLSGPGATTTGADFCIRVGTPVICGTCSSPCGPMCIFASAPSVAQVTSQCTQYQLSSRLNAGQSRTQCYSFTAVATSFSLQMIINTVGCGTGNVTSFNWSLYPSNCSGVIQSGTLANLNAVGLVGGAGYVLCYTWTAACQHNSVYPYMIATSPLPVELVTFEATHVNNNVILKWATASEVNNHFFSIQRSTDGIEFSEIGMIQGAGNSTTLQEYSFVDLIPLHGVSYYRLSQYDFDNTATLSNLVAVRFQKKFEVEVASNLVNDKLTVNLHIENNSTVYFNIFSPDGKIVATSKHDCQSGFNTISIPVESIRGGIYYLSVENVVEVSRLRFVKL